MGLVARTDFDGTERSYYRLCFSAERNLVERDTATLLKGGGVTSADDQNLFDPATGTFSFTGPPIALVACMPLPLCCQTAEC